MLARIPVDRRAWIPEEETYVIFSAFVYNNEKYLDLPYNEDLVGFAPKFGCFEMYVCSRQIIVAKSGKIFWKIHLKSSLQETEKNSLVLRFCRKYEETEEKENDNQKESCPISPEQKEDGAESKFKKERNKLTQGV